MKNSKLSHGLRYACFIIVPPMLIVVLSGFVSNFWTYGYWSLAVFLFLLLRSDYSSQKARIGQHIINHKNAETNSAPYVLLLRSFSLRGNYSIEESGQLLIAGSTEPVDQHVVISFLGNIDLALGEHGLTLVVIGSQDLSLPKKNRVLIVECPDDQWQANFRTLACNAKAILVVPESTIGIMEEIDYVKCHRLLGRTIILMPPSMQRIEKKWWIEEINLEKTEPRDQRWEQLKNILQNRRVALPPYDSDGALLTIGEHGSTSKKISLNGKEDANTFDLAFRQLFPILVGKWRPLNEVYRHLVPDKRYKEYDPIFDDVPGETVPFCIGYARCLLIIISLTALTIMANSVWIALLVQLLGILSMGTYMPWVFKNRLGHK